MKTIDAWCTGKTGRTLILFALTFLAVTAFQQVVGTLWWESQNLFAIPAYDDMFDHARMYKAIPHTADFLRYAVSLHNEHRIFTTRVISFLDDKLFHGREYAQVAIANLLQIFSAWMAWRVLIGRDFSSDVVYRVALFLAILLLFINPNLLYTLVFPFQVQHAIMAALCIGAAAFIARASEASDFSTQEYVRVVGVLILFALAATLTLGNAPVILIAAAIMAFLLRWRRWVIATLTVLALVHTLFIVATTGAGSAHSHHLFRILKFAILYWGGPFIRFEPWPAGYVTWWSSVFLVAFFGCVVLLVSVSIAIVRLFRPGLGGTTVTFGLTVLIVVIVTGLAAGLAREQFGLLEGASKKYASFAALGWLGVFAVFVGLLQERVKERVWRRDAIVGFALTILVSLSAYGSSHELGIWGKWRALNWDAALEVFLDIGDQGRMQFLDSEKSDVQVYASYAARHDLSIFSYFPFRWGDNATAFLAARKETTCRSEVERVDPIPTSDLVDVFDSPGTAKTISGWSWMDRDRKPATTVIAVDSSQRIVGVARTTRPNERAEIFLGQKFNQDLGWFGFARVVNANVLNFYALSSNGKMYCSLGTLGNVR